MFYFRYLLAELLRRLGKTITIVFGLAISSAIIIVIMSFSSGLSLSQEKVLNPLENVGTDIMLTRSLSSTDISKMDTETRQEYRQENQTRLNLAELGNPGSKFSNDSFSSGTLLSYESKSVTDKLDGDVAGYAGGLILNVTHTEGTVPNITTTFQSQARTFNVDLTDQQKAAFDEARTKADAEIKSKGLQPNSSEARDIQRKYMDAVRPTGTFTAPAETFTQNVGPIQTDTTTSNFTVSGVDITKDSPGLILKSQVVSGTYFTGADKEIIVNKSYADKNSKKVGDTLTLAKVEYKIAGIVEPKLYTNTTDLYLPLTVLQTIANKTGRINILLVKTTNANNVSAVSTKLSQLVTGATVVNSKDTADKVSGSIVQASKLTDKFMGISSFVVILSSLIIVSLLTVFSINKRVREIGTLKAIGWSKIQVVRQIFLENALLGLLGAVVGLGLGIAAIAIVNKYNISFDATVQSLNSGFTANRPGGTTTAAQNAQTRVSLQIPYKLTILLLGAGVAMLGAIVSGLFASLKVARLKPQVALRSLE